MRANRRVVSWIGIALVVAMLAGCGGGSSSSGGGGGGGGGGGQSCLNTGNGVDTMTLAGISYTEGQSGLATASGETGLCDPLIDTYVDSSVYLIVDFVRGILSPTDAVEFLSIDALPATGPQTTTWDLGWATSSGDECAMDTGTLTVSTLGSNGGRIVGNFTVDTWINFSGTCPANGYTGAFDGTRNDLNPFSTN